MITDASGALEPEIARNLAARTPAPRARAAAGGSHEAPRTIVV
jgi:hypothetical protein